jgi:uncharacterized Zn-binding protein involved in type VI secretion
MPPAARILDMVACPMFTGPAPHVAAPILLNISFNTMIGMLPAAKLGSMALCQGIIPNPIIKGSAGVMINSMPAARIGDNAAHGGAIILGLPTVIIGETGSASNSPLQDGAILAIIARSPTLTAQITELLKDGWTIEYGVAGGGSFCDSDGKRIVIDPNGSGDPAGVVQTLAHEAGHARYTQDPPVGMAGRTRDEYVNGNTNRHLKDEGEATLNNIQVQREINANGGPDIGIAGTQDAQYNQIYDRYPDPADRDRARQEIGNAFATGERPSTDAGAANYHDYYSKHYRDQWDAAHP